MVDVVEFIVKMKDMASGGMHSLATNARSAFHSMDNSIVRTQRNLSHTRPSIEGLNKKLDDLRRTRDLSIDTSQIRNANREIDRLERQVERTQNLGRRPGAVNGMLGSIIGGNLIASGIAATAGMVRSTMSDALNAAMQAGAQRVSFQTMAGSKAGGELYRDITKFAQDSIFGNELYQNAQTMLAFGASAREVMPDLRMLGDISMGNKEKLQSLTLAYSQIRSAGRLMGQDLLQLVNAGFNPLQIISEKTGKSMAELKKLVEKGAISFDMVRQAFISATSEGGRFYKMTDQIAQTSFGKWEALKGQWQGALIELGNAMMPFASSLTDVASDTLHFLNISKTVPETLQTEKLEINQLVKSIVSLNEKNEIRSQLLEMLHSKYPDLFSNLDIEKVKNNQLLETLNKINEAYSKKISLAIYDEKIGKLKEEVKYLQELSVKAGAGTLGVRQQIAAQWYHGIKIDKNSKQPFAQQLMSQAERLVQDYNRRVAILSQSQLATEANSFARDKELQKAMWGKDATANFKEFNSEMIKWRDAFNKKVPFDTSRIKELMAGSGVSDSRGGKSGGAVSFSGLSPTSTSTGITGGGARQITINLHRAMIEGGVNIHAQRVEQGLNDMGRMVREELLRILDSANAIS